nr:MAG TPA: hypothetical protein [Caudoviricetes sp.]
MFLKFLCESFQYVVWQFHTRNRLIRIITINLTRGIQFLSDHWSIFQ